jgi:hypothetical protein
MRTSGSMDISLTVLLYVRRFISACLTSVRLLALCFIGGGMLVAV